MKYLFPTTNEDQNKALAGPVAFFTTEFLRTAGTLALLFAVTDVVGPSVGHAVSPPGVRLSFILFMGLGIAASRLVAARIRSRK